MRVSLVFTPNQLNPNFKELAFRDESLGYVPPLSLMYVAAIMEKEGAQVDIIDMDAECLSYAQTLERIKRFSPDLLGFTMTTSSFHPVLQWLKEFKKDTGLPVVVGGEHIKLYPYETMSHKEIDFCIVGEGELPIPEFLKAFRTGGPYEGVKSLGYRDKDGTVRVDTTKQAVADIDMVPRPALHLIKNELYENVLTRRKNFTAMVSTRGCPFRCAFCNQNLQPYRTRSAMSFVDEVEDNLRKYNIRDFDIYDSTFTADKKRVIAICNEIKRRKLDVGFTVRSRVDVVNQEMLDALKSAGCHTIMYGVESSSLEILKRMNKKITPQRCTEIINYTHRLGIDMLGFFMFGFPGETKETIEDTIRFALELPLDYAQFTVLLPFTETEIYDYYRERGLEDYWGEVTVDPSKERVIELIDTGVTREEASRYVALAYKKFYFRPRIILKRFLRVRSWREFKRLAKGALGILSNSNKAMAETTH